MVIRAFSVVQLKRKNILLVYLSERHLELKVNLNVVIILSFFKPDFLFLFIYVFFWASLCEEVGYCDNDRVNVSVFELYRILRLVICHYLYGCGQTELWTHLCNYRTFKCLCMWLRVCTLAAFSTDRRTQHNSTILFCSVLDLTPLNNNSISLRPAPAHHQPHTAWMGAAN